MSPETPAYLKGLNDKQLEAVLHTDTPLLILAGAGSGKTRVITVKMAWLVESMGFRPWNLLAVTFTNKAAKEMRDRLLELSPACAGAMLKTFHSFCGFLLRRYGDSVGLPASFSIYDDDDSLSLLKSLYPNFEKKVLKQNQARISRAKDYALTPESDLTSITDDESFPAIYAAYQKRLNAIGNVDFGDLILKTIFLLRQFPEIRQKVQDHFRVLLVDEYQDSNVAQFELLKLLYAPQNYLCVVGDDDQSIYRFRGAEVQNILSFADSFKGTKIIRLEQNYRSSGNIVQAASGMIAANKGRLGKVLWTENPLGPKIKVYGFLSDDREQEAVVRWIDPANPNGYAILYRTNAQSVGFEKALSEAGIPHRLVGAVGFFNREEIRDSVALLKLLVNPKDIIAFKRIVNKPARGVGPATQEAVAARADAFDGDLFRGADAYAQTGKGKAAAGIAEFLTFYQTVRSALGDASLSAVLQLLLEKSGLLAYYQAEDRLAASYKTDNINELVRMAADYPAGTEGIVSFLEEMKLDTSMVEENRATEEQQPAVTLITMHNTKGLEFDHVWISGMEEGVFPSFRSLGSPDEVEEERRLFYVAMTRARKTLSMASVASRFLWGQSQMLSPSRFLSEVPQDFLEQEPSSASAFGRGTEGASAADRPTDYRKGRWVYNDEYGKGVIIKNWMAKGKEMVFVRFETGKIGQFLTQYNRLELIADDE